ncbi:MAG: hypothetical protein RL417_1647 [Pseudomonadota bacterium]
MPNLHPPLTAFPLVLLLSIACLEVIAWRRKLDWNKPIEVLLVFMVVAVVAAFFSGYQASEIADRTFAVPNEPISWHHTIGRFLLFLSIPCAALRFVGARARFNQELFRYGYRLTLAGCIGLAIYTGYLGGELVFRHGAGVYASPESLALPPTPR